MHSPFVDYDLPKKRHPHHPDENAISSNLHDRWLEEQLRLRTAPSKRILWIEDDVDLAGFLAGELKKTYPCRIDLATNAQEAVERATQEFYDLVILDWHLPPMNGSQTLMSIEKAMFSKSDLPEKWKNKSVPVVIFSSATLKDCLFNNTIHFNYAGFISKTQPIEHIFETLTRWMDPQENN